MQITVLAVAFILSLFFPQSAGNGENPLVSGYMRQDNISTIGGEARLIRPAFTGPELLYHRSLGGMFFVSAEYLFQGTDRRDMFQGEKSVWPNHTEPVIAGFYPLGRGMTGLFVNVTTGPKYSNDGYFGAGEYEWHAGCRLNLKYGFVLKAASGFSHWNSPDMSLEFVF